MARLSLPAARLALSISARGVNAEVILTYAVGVKMTRLGVDGGLVAAEDADPGAGSGDQSTGPSRRADSGDCTAARLFAEYGKAVSG